jgi:hypothetical protein
MNTKFRMHRLLLIGFALFFSSWQPHGYAQNADRMEDLQRRYDFVSWAGTTKGKYAGLLSNWTPDYTSIPMARFAARGEEQKKGNQREIRFAFHPADNPEVIVDVRILECESIMEAHRAMLQHFNNCAALHPLPLGSKFGLDLGDRCYTGYSKSQPSSLVFVRNNES